MIRYRNKIYEEFSIDANTAVITDKDGNIMKQHILQGRPYFKSMTVQCIQAHTAWGYKQGYHVHHKDGNPLNNAISNLDYISKGEHTRIHKYHSHHGIKTMCEETGEIFKTIRELAKRHRVSTKVVLRLIRKHLPVNGMHYIILNNEQITPRT